MLSCLLLICASLFTSPSGVEVPNSKAVPEVVLKGHVRASQSKAPVHSVLTVVSSGIKRIEINTDQDGEFQVAFPAVAEFIVTAKASGYDIEEVEVSLPVLKADSTLEIYFWLDPHEKMKMTGNILNRKTKEPIPAEFDLYFDNDFIKEDVKIANEGKFEEAFNHYGWYIINISAPGYLSESDTIWVMNNNRAVMQKDYLLTPIEEGLTVRLKNIQFYFGKTSLHPDSFKELTAVLEILKSNPTVKLEIAGHTDNEGPDDYNLMLSQGRAQSVVDYLISQGANSLQLIAKGYGETKPIDLRETKQAKATNRRVEFTVLGNL